MSKLTVTPATPARTGRSMRRRLTVVAAAAVALVSFATMATPAQAAVVNRGYATSSVYLSRSETRYVNARMEFAQASGGPVLASGCGALALVPVPGVNLVLAGSCLGAMAGYGTAFKHATASAAHGGGCLRIRFTNTRVPVIVGFYNDGGKYCRN